MELSDFLKDVSRHKILIAEDNGVSRLIVVRGPDTSRKQFEIVTWPGHLCFVSDTGSFTFARLPDMFEFFRRPDLFDADRKCAINYDYWAEMLMGSKKPTDGEDFTQAFLWCCYAIPWAIDQYDKLKAERAALESVRDYALSAVRANVPEGWKSIESAPKYGLILLYGKYGSDSQGKMQHPMAGYWNETSERWECVWMSRFGVRPTHWMPLPSAPEFEVTK